MILFRCDYGEGAHPEILRRLVETNFEQMDGYGCDPYSESADERVRNAVRECVEGSRVVSPVKNDAGLVCGYQITYAMFWAALSTVRDFNLLYRIFPQR